MSFSRMLPKKAMVALFVWLECEPGIPGGTLSFMVAGLVVLKYPSCCTCITNGVAFARLPKSFKERVRLSKGLGPVDEIYNSSDDI